MRAGLRERRRRRQPDAAPAAGDERAPAVEAEGRGFGEVDRCHDGTLLIFTLPWRGRVGGEAAGVG
jgi:hypothetical protein